MAISPTTSSTPATTTATSTAKGNTTSAAEQQDRFMKLLVTQMKNQDPLNPMDNAQMTSQIAQINTVAGIEKLNTTVEGLTSQFAAIRSLVEARLPPATAAVVTPTAAEGTADASSTSTNP